MQSTERIHSLDHLRGILIFITLMQHFCGIIHYYGYEFTAELSWLFTTLTPFGAHIFIMLATFNLAMRRKEDFQNHYSRKIISYLLVFIYFSFEGYLMSLGSSLDLEWNFLMTWMSCLILIATCYNFASWKVIPAIFVIQLLLWIFDLETWHKSLEASLSQSYAYGDFEYSAPYSLTIGSACIGFILGYIYYHFNLDEKKFVKAGSLCSFVLVICLYLIVPGWSYDVDDVFSLEFSLAYDFIGILYIWAIGCLCVFCSLYLYQLTNNKRISMLAWCGEKSLAIFATHKLIYGYFFMYFIISNENFREWYTNSITNTVGLTAIVLLFTFLLYTPISLLVRKSLSWNPDSGK